MTISEMHSMFRTLGQQKGMQHVRAILPAEIDDYLNAAIIEKCRTILGTNVSTVFNDKLSVRDNPISPANAFRTLYKEHTTNVTGELKPGQYYQIQRDNSINPMLYISFALMLQTSDIDYPCRFVENDKVRFLIHDFCNAPSVEYPIVTIINTENTQYYRVYIGNVHERIKLKVAYIEMPAKVQYPLNGSTGVNCNLPEYLHQEIVEQAVQKFFVSVGATTHQVKQ